MADPYADMASQDVVLQNRIGDALEARCKEQAQVEIREAYLRDLKLPDHAFAIELGSGTGQVTHELLTLAKANRALGIEPSPVLVERAKKTSLPSLGSRFKQVTQKRQIWMKSR